ncbi:GH25 family lysozyme [Cardinium endosymbiont of Tipula unca]|uniref:GH25 family lysozyme n=1 Tax=Cardinium endosymbiont of Tipula unca TaxID=3066216 RepID=UPI003BB0DFD6
MDVEEQEGTPLEAYKLVSSVTEACVTYLIEQGIMPFIYTRTNFWNKYVSETPEVVKRCPLWISKWSEIEPSLGELPNGWNKWTIWQYADKGSVPGIEGNRPSAKESMP